MATDFSSLDKLIEFGLGLGIATQMMNTMNTVISNTAYPGVGINPGVIAPEKVNLNQVPATLPEEYYIVKEDRVAGPLSEQELDILIKKGIVGRQTFCWRPGRPSWAFAMDIPEVNKLLLLNSVV